MDENNQAQTPEVNSGTQAEQVPPENGGNTGSSTTEKTEKSFTQEEVNNEIERDLTQRAAVGETPTDSEEVTGEHAEQQKTAAVSDCESVSEEVGTGKRRFFGRF